MVFRRRQTHRPDLERALRAQRPEPTDRLVDSIVARVEGSRRPARARPPRLVLVGALTAALLAALGYVGGAGYASSSITHAAQAVKKVFVAESSKKAAKKEKKAAQQRPRRSAAADQYGPPPTTTGTFLPPGLTPQLLLNQFAGNVADAVNTLRTDLDCASRTGAARRACLRRQAAYNRLANRFQRQFRVIQSRLPSLTAEQQAALSRLLAIHLQQRNRLAAAQERRRTNCSRAAFRSTHRRVCANLDAKEQRELIRLTNLQLQELNGLLGL